MKIHPDSNERGESRGPPISRNCAEDRDAFSRPIFGHCFCPPLGGNDLPFRRVGGKRAGFT
jgi:hypothetical protein